MAAGNASNTIFTAIPVGEDFYMSFSTERFQRTIAPQDFTRLNFKLYDARTIGSVGNPNPNAIIKEYNNQPLNAVTNPGGRPSFFRVNPNSISVLISSDELDTYEQTKTGNSTAVFKGELYGFVEATVTGEEINLARLVPGPIIFKSSVIGNLQQIGSTIIFWDGYFFREDLRSVATKLRINSPALGATNT
jgi:hypothetical protein